MLSHVNNGEDEEKINFRSKLNSTRKVFSEEEKIRQILQVASLLLLPLPSQGCHAQQVLDKVGVVKKLLCHCS